VADPDDADYGDKAGVANVIDVCLEERLNNA